MLLPLYRSTFDPEQRFLEMKTDVELIKVPSKDKQQIERREHLSDMVVVVDSSRRKQSNSEGWVSQRQSFNLKMIPQRRVTPTKLLLPQYLLTQGWNL
jgi:hypothetical protein